jgi:DNA-directed RNA polymerase specialized sigma24 family protein
MQSRLESAKFIRGRLTLNFTKLVLSVSRETCERLAMKTDRELLQAYKNGDGNAFTDFFNRHVKSVTRWVCAHWNSPLSDIDWAVQNAFLAISRREEIPDDPVIYLQQSAIQRAKEIKANKRRRSKRFESVHEADFDGTSIAGDRKSAQFIAREYLDEHPLDTLNRAVDQAIGKLTPRQREVLCELRKDNHTCRVAKKLGIHNDTVGYHRDRAMAKLKPLLA